MSLAGDHELGRRTAELIKRDGDAFAVVVVDRSGLRLAGRGLRIDDCLEIGSVSKAITGLLLHDGIAREEVTADSTLGGLLGLTGSIGAVTLGSLATHTSGLPRLPPHNGTAAKTWRLLTRGDNPYGESLESLLGQVRTLRPKAGGRPRYSNLGYMLLGHALAAAAGLRYADLVRERIATPLGMTKTSVPHSLAELAPEAPWGRNRRGRPAEPWTGEALGPAGGIRASIEDLGRLLQGLLDGTAPGTPALDPVRNFSGTAVRIGAAWVVVEHKSRDITWHNGQTGGFSSCVGLDRVGGRAVAVVRGSTRSVDRVTFALLTGD